MYCLASSCLLACFGRLESRSVALTPRSPCRLTCSWIASRAAKLLCCLPLCPHRKASPMTWEPLCYGPSVHACRSSCPSVLECLLGVGVGRRRSGGCTSVPAVAALRWTCVWGAERTLSVTFLHNVPAFASLSRRCDDFHTHLPWSQDEPPASSDSIPALWVL